MSLHVNVVRMHMHDGVQIRIPESATLQAHISQRSSLMYMKAVLDHFDKRHPEDFRNSSLSVQGHLMRFGLQEYELMTGLRCGAFQEDAEFDRLLERRRLKERYFKSNDKISLAQLQFAMARSSTPRADRYKLGLVLILKGVFNATDNNVGTHLPTLSIVDDLDLFFGYPWGRVGYRHLLHEFRDIWVWAYEALLEVEVGERFAERLHVYAKLRPTDAEAQQPYFSTLVPYNEPPVPILDDIARTVVAPQFNASSGNGCDGGHATREDSKEEASEGERNEEQTSRGDDEKGASSIDPDGEDSEDTGESHGEGSSAGEDTRGGARGASSSPRSSRDPSPERRSTTQARAVRTSAPGLSRGDVEELLLDQRILFEMRLRIVKLEI
ncbi:Hypothetical predicted protein [Olea europaea subsp. europaea]|uniref:DUF1985 domain-containing protein n=1 Tax=Olea europaea subsp. europaea TaxID=158383 RepID=A0A8S0TVL1_OLEEU|nr:Hypothetical predicted protein [Olea europaea subsp. europaea]